VELDSVADQLYGLTPREFTSARDRLAAEARDAGDRDLAAGIKKLRRPTVAAWLANLLTRQRPDDIDRLIALGQGLREAQEQLDADELRQLSQQRHLVVGGLVDAARELAAAVGGAGAGGRERSGPPLSESVARELQETLEAAMSDPNAAEALRSGRLTTAISYSGLGFDHAGEVATAAATRRPGPPPAVRSHQDGKAGEQEAAAAAVRAARSQAAGAQRALDQQARQARRLAEAAAGKEREVAELRRRLAEAEGEHGEAVAASASADQAVAAAEAELAQALERVKRAETALGFG
jgi:hypothetical protein